MKKILLFLLWFTTLRAQAQVETSITVPTTASGNFPALLYLPDDYNTTTGNTYPVIFFWHGSGQSCPPPSNLYNTQDGGPAYWIEHAGWPTGGFLNRADGKMYKFIVVSVQSNCNNWSTSGFDMTTIITFMLSHYRIDPTRIYHTGLSAGAAGIIQLISGLCENPSTCVVNPTVPRCPGAVIMSQAEGGYNSTPTSNGLSWGVNAFHDSTHQWNFGDTVRDIHGSDQKAYTDGVNAAKAGYARFTEMTTGHNGWGVFYNPTYHETFTWNAITANMNIYEWLLLNALTSTPVTTPTAAAGPDQSITQPTSSVTLSGSGTPGTGHSIASYTWTQPSGPSSTITNPGPSLSANTTTVTGLSAPGIYTYQLKVLNEAGASATDQVQITVISNAPTANAGGDQTIVLPNNTVTLDGTGSTGTITSYAWTQVAGGPNTANINSPTASTTSVTGMIQGVYKFALSLNGGTSKDTVQITVNPIAPCGPRNKYVLAPNGDTAMCEGCNGHTQFAYQPGDTLVIPHNPTANAGAFYRYLTFANLNGNPTCPLVIINDTTAQTLCKGQIQIDGCTYIKLIGAGKTSLQYGFKIQYDPVIVPQVIGGIIIFDRSKNIEVTNVDINHVGTGIACLTDNNCDQSLDYPNWILDSMVIHDNRIVEVWNEGMYWGNTSPDNAFYDRRVDQCDTAQPVQTFSLPMKNGYTHVFNMIIDSTGRGGIQFGNVGGTNQISEIDHNTVTRSGLNQDDAQGTAISMGQYTHVNVHDNICRNTYTWGIANLGGSGTNLPITIQNNQIDSCGFLRGFPRLSETPDEFYNPNTEAQANDTLIWPYAIEFDVKPRIYTTDNPAGTAVHGADSSQFHIIGNRIGLTKAVTRPNPAPGQRNVIQIFDYQPNPGLQKTGNLVCSNVFFNDQPALAWADSSNGNVIYSTNCNTGTPPTLTACIVPPTGPVDSTVACIAAITLPQDSVKIFSSCSNFPFPTDSILSVTVTQLSGPTCTIFNGTNTTHQVETNLTTTIRSMDTPGLYQFTSTCRDKNGNVPTKVVSITVNAANVPASNYIPVRKYSKKRYIGH